MPVMNRLQIELNRLYAWGERSADAAAVVDVQGDRQGGVRVLVLALALPAGWLQLSEVWKGVQSDLDLPAPAIAISGLDGLELWFSLATPTSPSVGAAFLEGLRARYLPGVDPGRVRAIMNAQYSLVAPPVEVRADRWSAFVAPDLVSLFTETPWLDIPPTDDGQATLLRSLEPIPAGAFEAALRQLGLISAGTPDDPPNPAALAGPVGVGEPRTLNADPRRFLEGVMSDETAPLALRVDAAKALLLAQRVLR